MKTLIVYPSTPRSPQIFCPHQGCLEFQTHLTYQIDADGEKFHLGTCGEHAEWASAELEKYLTRTEKRKKATEGE